MGRKLVIVLGVIYFLLLSDIMCLYILYYLTLRQNPGYTYHNFDKPIPIINKVVYTYTGIVLAGYFTFYLTAIVLNCKYIRQASLG